jgi:L-amino acid N-acyltransferase YncA
MTDEILHYPRRIHCRDTELELRLMAAGDEAVALAFANALPVHDLLFLQRDIREAKVVSAWIEQIERGSITSHLAVASGKILGCTAVVRDVMSWSPHVGELRIVVAEAMRGSGLGRVLMQEAFALAVSLGLEKVLARMTPDQRAAMVLFEEMGFRPEALLRDQVRDAEGKMHDIVILSLEVEKHRAQRLAYGYDAAS